MLEVILTGIVMFMFGYIAAYLKTIYYQQRAERALKECVSILKDIVIAAESEAKPPSDRSKVGKDDNSPTV